MQCLIITSKSVIQLPGIQRQTESVCAPVAADTDDESCYIL